MDDSTASGNIALPTRVKICGITNLDDALLAVESGADYLGFIFYPPSKRSITVKKAQRIVAELRTRPDQPFLVGVFVNETGSDMAQILTTCQLDLAQLSGDETPNLVGDPESPIYGRCYKVLRPATLDEAQAEAEWYLPAEIIAAQLARDIPNLMLAGGLNPDNVAAAVSQVRPFAVDAASGVEATPGKKDPRLVRSFIANAKNNRPGPDPIKQ